MREGSASQAVALGLLALSLLSVVQVPSANAQFINGADVSWLPQMEAAGYVFRNRYGVQMNCLDVLKEEGIDAIRIRAWVDPIGGYCGTKYVTKLAREADSLGFNVLIDFHCSDTWADPGHQTIPAAWSDDSLPQLLTQMYNYIYGVMDTLKSVGVVPKWVQVGNETDNGMLWPLGEASTHMGNFAEMIDTGYAAIKAVDSTTQVIVHLSQGNNDALYRRLFDGLRSYGARWDIIGMSVYPAWVNLPWDEDDSLAQITMKDMIARYHTKVMVVEAGYTYDQPVRANHFLLDLIAKTKAAGGLGVFYWEPECYNWQNYQLGAWDPRSGEPTVAMDAFLGTEATAVDKSPSVPGYSFSVYPNPFNPSTTISYSLPLPARVSITIYNVRGEEVRQLINGYELSGSHTVTWSPRNVSSGVYFCRITAGGRVATVKMLLLK